MQRSRSELEAMTHTDLVDRVLELQDVLREGLAVRNALHEVLNRVLLANQAEVVHYADADEASLSDEEIDRKRAWAAARMAVANPSGRVRSG